MNVFAPSTTYASPSRRARVPRGGHVGTSAGFGDRERTDGLAGQRRADVAPRELAGGVGRVGRSRGGRDVRQRDPVGEQRRDQPGRAAGPDDRLRDHGDVDRVTALPAERLREADAEQAGVGGALVQLARNLADVLPGAEVRDDLAFREPGRGLV